MAITNGQVFAFTYFLFTGITRIESATSTCFMSNFTIKDIPTAHIYHKIGKPAVIGYKGSIMNYQENTLEGLKDLIKRKLHMHMEVQMTKDEKIILFADESLKRMTGIDVPTSIATYKHIKDMNLKASVVYGNKTFKYKKTAKIPLLEDVLNAVKGKGLLIYIELKPSNAPPKDPGDRYRSLRTGIIVGKLIRKLGMENDVFITSADPFKLLAINYINAATVTSWSIKKSFYKVKAAERIRKEFVDLNGLRTCYVSTAPKGVDFIPFLLETGIVTKSVNGSFIDVDFELLDNPVYLSGRSDKTISLLEKNYNPRISVGAFLTYYSGDVSDISSKEEIKKISAAKKAGIERFITDDIDRVNQILFSIGSSGMKNSCTALLFYSLMVFSAYLSL